MSQSGSRNWRTAAALVLALCAAAWGAWSGPAAKSAGKTADVITQPKEWVPLTIEFHVRDQDGAVLGTFVEQRDAQGSTRTARLEGGLERDIQIINMSRRRYFRFKGGAWYQYPLRIQPGGGRPTMVLLRNRVQPVSPDDPRIRSLSALGRPLSYYEFVGSSGNKVVLCPELNMLMAWGKFSNGTERQLDNVTIGQPNVSFEPPTDVTVTYINRPSGPGVLENLPSLSKADH